MPPVAHREAALAHPNGLTACPCPGASSAAGKADGGRAPRLPQAGWEVEGAGRQRVNRCIPPRSPPRVGGLGYVTCVMGTAAPAPPPDPRPPHSPHMCCHSARLQFYFSSAPAPGSHSQPDGPCPRHRPAPRPPRHGQRSPARPLPPAAPLGSGKGCARGLGAWRWRVHGHRAPWERSRGLPGTGHLRSPPRDAEGAWERGSAPCQAVRKGLQVGRGDGSAGCARMPWVGGREQTARGAPSTGPLRPVGTCRCGPHLLGVPRSPPS